MVDLGKYAAEVLASYAATIILLVALVALSVQQARKVRQDLAEAERDEQ